MRKLIAFPVCMFLLLILGFAFLHPTFILLANWLGPLMGNSMLTALTMIYILLGDPLRYATIFVLWGSVALLCGTIIRRRIGATLTILLIFLISGFILAVSIYDIFTFVLEMDYLFDSNPLEALPPLPKGLTFAQLYEAPVIGSLIKSAVEITQTGPLSNPMQIVTSMVTPILVSLGTKLVIVIIAALVGTEIGKIIEPYFTPYSEALKRRLNRTSRLEVIQPISPRITNRTLIAATLLIFLLPLSCFVYSSGNNFYSENLFGYIDGDGSAYIGYLFMESESPFTGLEVEGCLASVIISQEGIKDAIPSLINMGEFASFLNMVPTTMMVNMFIDVSPEVASQRSQTIASSFSKTYNVHLSELMAFTPPLPIEENSEAPIISIVIFQSTDSFEALANTFLNHFSNKEGLVDLIIEASKDMIIDPISGPDSADGSIIASGYVNLESIYEYIPEEMIADMTDILPMDSRHVFFSGGLSFWERGVEDTGEGQSFEILSLLGIENEASFSETSDMSLVLLIDSNGTDIGGEEFTPNVEITSSLSHDHPIMDLLTENFLKMGSINQVEQGEILDPSSFSVAVSGFSLPLHVEVIKEVSSEVTQVKEFVNIEITVKNLDTEIMEDVILDDRSTITKFERSAQITSGSAHEEWSEIDPGKSRTISYTLQLSHSGIYNIEPAILYYTKDNKFYTEYSQSSVVSVKWPSSITMSLKSLSLIFNTVIKLLDYVSGGAGSTILVGFVGAVTLVILFLEYRNLKKWIG
jgi:hypothetical protein